MPSLHALLVSGLMAAGAFARPSMVKRYNDGYCLAESEAQQVADNYAQLIRSYSLDLANAALDVDFTDYSESVNTLINECPQGSAAISLPLLSPSFTNRSAFELGQGQQASINFQQLDIWHSCDTVIIRWETTNTANITNVKPVVGVIVMETSLAPAGNQYPYLIKKVFSEFDAGAWLSNIQAAGFCPPPSVCSSVSATFTSVPMTTTSSATGGEATAFSTTFETSYSTATAYTTVAAR